MPIQKMFAPYRSIQKQVHFTRRLQRDLELTEANSWRPFYTTGDSEVSQLELDGTLVAAIPGVDKLLFNRVLGLGMRSLVLTSIIDEIIDFYQAQQVNRFMVQLSPYVIPEDTEEQLMARGFQQHDHWIKLLWNKNFILPTPDHDFEIAEVKPGEESLYVATILSIFEWPPALAASFKASIHKPGFHHYLVKKDNQVVGAGSTYIENKIATLKIAGTIAPCRNQGVHFALTQRQIEDALGEGCEWITAETEENERSNSRKAYKNLRRLGFEEAYTRKNLVYYTSLTS